MFITGAISGCLYWSKTTIAFDCAIHVAQGEIGIQSAIACKSIRVVSTEPIYVRVHTNQNVHMSNQFIVASFGLQPLSCRPALASVHAQSAA